MSVKPIKFGQIKLVSGGYSDINNVDDIKRANFFLGDCITRVISKDSRFDEELSRCLKIISCGEECFSRCAPKKKPKECNYGVWGMLADAIEEGVIKRC